MIKPFRIASAALILAAASARPLPAADTPATPPALPTSTLPDTPHATPPAPQYWIGVAVENIPPAIGKLMKLTPGQGLLVAAIVNGSPAEAAKLQAGDLLIAVNGQPLLSQRQLVEAANSPHQDAAGQWLISPASIEYIREGAHATANLTPAPRPTQFLVTGTLTPHSNSASTTGQTQITAPLPADQNLAAGPNGLATLQVGPGIVINLNAAAGANSLNSASMQQIAAKGQTVIFSEESDSLGHTRYSVTVGDKSYDVDPANLAALPPDVQQLVRPFLPQRIRVNNRAPAPDHPATLSELTTKLQNQIKIQQDQINALTQQIHDLANLLQKQQNTPEKNP